MTSPHILYLSRGVLWNQIKMRIDESCSADSEWVFQGLRKDPTGGMLQNLRKVPRSLSLRNVKEFLHISDDIWKCENVNFTFSHFRISSEM